MRKAPDYRRMGLPILILGCSIVFITYFTKRYESVALLSAYLLGFVAYLSIALQKESIKYLKHLLIAAFLLRCCLLPAIPNLSDDVYRFIWDGRLWAQDINPFTYLPSEIIGTHAALEVKGIDKELYALLNSPDYFTIYPPVNQFIFALAARLFPSSIICSIIVIRLFIIMAEGITLWLIYRLLQQAKMPVQRTLWYALNPLVILELSGNLHFEGVMLCFLLLSLYFMNRQKLALMAISFALAVCTKLLPVIFLPLYLRRLGIRKAIYFYSLTALATMLLFLPLLSQELIAGMGSSLGLYFQKFEFNASIYYIIREIGYMLKGYNIIATAGKWLAVSAFLLIILFSCLERNKHIPAAFLWVMFIYLLLSTTVHPWYIIPLVAFSIFTSYRFAIFWSLLVFFSYAGYTVYGFQENLWITIFEYVLILGILGYEVYRHRRGGGPNIFFGLLNPKLHSCSFLV